MQKHSRFELARKILLFWCLFIGLGAVAGATGMFVAIDGSAMGMQPILPYFQVLPFADRLFQNFLFPGIALLIVNGLSNLLAAYLLVKRKPLGVTLGGIFGVTLMLWITIQFIIFPQNILSTSYFIFGALQAVTGYAAHVFYAQERFTVSEADYPNIGKNPRLLLVYFSRMGYVKKAAFERANETGAKLFALETTERTEGTPGFWWCGRYGMHRWDMPLRRMPENLESYERVTVCSPIWVFALAAPVRAFLRAARGKIRRADYILVHHTRGRYENAVREMNGLLGIRADDVLSLRCRLGKMRSV